MRVWLELGRVSNLPTVWTNALAGVALAGGDPGPGALAVVIAAMSAMYVGGMYLNDAFDRELDAHERPERPIPSGRVQARSVFTAGYGLLALGAGATPLAAMLAGQTDLLWPSLSALALAGVIILYNLHHKGNPLSPLIMGMARVGVYACAALVTAPSLSAAVLWGMLALLGYLIGLTYVAKQESFNEVANWWPLLFLGSPFAFVDVLSQPMARGCYIALVLWVAWTLRGLMGARRNVGAAVTRFIAGLCILDAMWVASAGHADWVLLCVAAFGLTRLGQRVIAGT